jgi:NADPH:quinone reductase-like Zn-dependent oxidoreductase
LEKEMEAVRLERYRDPDGVRLARIAIPEPAAGEVLVRVKAAGVNPVDWKIAEGFGEFLGLAPPFTLGCELAGDVAALGEGVSGLAIGEPVFGYVSLERCGAYAPYVIALPTEIAPKPPAISYPEAAAAAVGGETAWQALVETAGLRDGERVLIHAAAGGVGSVGVQLAKSLGAMVIGTASAHNEGFVRELGADEFVDYTAGPFEEAVAPVDVVFDTVGGDTLGRSFNVLKPGGRLVSIVEVPDPDQASQEEISAEMIAVLPEGGQLVKLGEMMTRGELRVNVARRYPLSGALEALAESRAGHVRGKLIIEP